MIFLETYYMLWLGILLVINITVQVASELDSQKANIARNIIFRLRARESHEKINVNSMDSSQTAGKEVLGPIVPVIVDGYEVTRGTWPWMVALFLKDSEDETEKFICGGSLISRSYLLTAAHCCHAGNNNPAKFSIRVGSRTSDNGTEYDLESVLVHPGYSALQLYHDLCILKVAEPVVLSKYVKPVALPSESVTAEIERDNRKVLVTGWGSTYYGGSAVHVLRQVMVEIIPQKNCNETYNEDKSSLIPNGITDDLICAGKKRGGKGPCQGDSGGPLVTKMRDGVWILIGTTSFVIECETFSVFTRLSKYLKFIYNNTDIRENK